VAEEEQDEDDRHIRFTIGGVGQRMTKEDFIREMQKLDKGTRQSVVDESNASSNVKNLAKQDPKTEATQKEESLSTPRTGRSRAALSPIDTSGKTRTPANSSGDSKSTTVGTQKSLSPKTCQSSEQIATATAAAAGGGSTSPSNSSIHEPESAVEKRRRLAVLKGLGERSEGTDVSETPAERRRREAALGMTGSSAEVDSEDDDTPRVVPQTTGGGGGSSRRGIRFADAPKPGAK